MTDHGDEPPHLRRPLMRESIMTAVQYDPEKVRAVIVDRALDDYADALVESVKLRKPCDACGQPPRPSVGALRLFSNIAKLTGSALGEKISALLMQLGVNSLHELSTAVSTYHAASSTTLEDARDEGVELLKAVLIERPEWYDGVVGRLASVKRRQIDRSVAVVLPDALPETNGKEPHE